MEQIGSLKEVDGRYEFRHEPSGLVVRGDFYEWVLAAAAEVLATAAKAEDEGRVDELASLSEFGEANPIEVDSARYALKARFEMVPQCTVTMGSHDYRWVAPEARDRLPGEFDNAPFRRIHDMALTRNDTFLENEDGVDTSKPTN
jgi:hypothetical protein